MTIEQKAFIRERLMDLLEIAPPLPDEEDLGIYGLNSIKTIQLIVELEERFDFEFTDEELLFGKFSSVQKITELVSLKAAIKR